MAYFTVGHRLPHFLSARLFGDREKHGLVAREDDRDWLAWQEAFAEAYDQTQKRSIGKVVNDAGYGILGRVSLADTTVLELGPGDIQHTMHWRGRPRKFVLADVRRSMLDRSQARLEELGVSCETYLLGRSGEAVLPFEAGSFDVVLCFYVLEHLYPLEPHVKEINRVLKPGGRLVSAIPTEGGLAWGLGRALTSRRWFKAHTDIDLDKVICWEHPNYAEQVMRTLDATMVRRRVQYWPWRLPCVDANLLIQSIHERR